MKKTYRLSVLALAVLMGTAQAGEVAQWRFGDDLLGNAPGSPWYYGWRNQAGQSAQPLDATATLGSQRGRYTRVSLSGRRDTFHPGIWANIGTTAINSVKPGEVALRPGPQRQPAFVRWTAPSDGAYRIEARFGAGNAPAADLLVTKNGVTGFSANNETRDREFVTSVQLKAGDQLEFSATNTTSGLDNQVPLQLLISRDTAPTPPSTVPLPPSAGEVTRQIDYDSRGSLVGFQIGEGQYERRLIRGDVGAAATVVVRENGRETFYREGKKDASRTVEVDRNGQNTRFLLDSNGRVIQRLDSRGFTQSYQRSAMGGGYQLIVNDPDRTRTEISYDEQGRPRMVRDGRGKVANYVWSDTSVQINYGPGENAIFNFNRPGQLREARNETASYNYQYADGERLSLLTQQIGPMTLRQEFLYQNGQLFSHIYPSGRRVEYLPSGPGRGLVKELRFAGLSLLSNIQYAENGEPKSWTWPNGRVWQASYDRAGLTTGVTLGNHNEIVRFDPMGRLESLDIGYGPQRYLYSVDGALTEARVGADVYGYQYDIGANRVAQRVNGNEIRYQVEPTGNRVYRVSGVGVDRPWAYDQTGNRIDEGNSGVFELYNQANRLVTYGGWTYGYGPDGARVTKKAPDSGVSVFVYGPDGKLISEYEPNGALRSEVIWFMDRPVALWRYGSVYLIMTDHLKTPRQLVSLQTGKVVWNWSADEPFGASQPDEDYDRDGVRIGFNLRFPGHYFDAESNRHYAGSRYYEPASGRYLQLGAWRPFDLENPYAYANHQPASYSSPDGGASQSPIRTDRVKLGPAKSLGMVTTTGYPVHSLTQGAKPLLDSLPVRPTSANAATVRTPAPLLLWRDETSEKLEANYR